MKYLADADTVLEGILNRSKTNESVAKLWNSAYTQSSEVYISRIGLNRIESIINLFADMDKDAVRLMELIVSTFKVVEVDSDILEEARRIDLAHNDFESSVEIVCAAEYNFDGIVTDRSESFRYTNRNSEISSKYQQEIMDVESLCTEIQHQSSASFPLQQLDLKNPNLKTNPNSNNLRLRDKGMMNKHNYLKIRLQTGSPVNQLKPVAKLSDLSLLSDKVSHQSFVSDKVVDFYMGFAEKYGGLDWGDYHENCKVIAAEWDNLEKVLSYSFKKAESPEPLYYAKFVKLWNLLNRFCDLYGYHNDRIFWLDKIIDLSYKQQNWSDYLGALTSKAWTLIMINRVDETKDYQVTAENVLVLAKEKLELVDDISLKFRYHHCSTLYHIHTQQLDLAREDLARSRNLFNKIAAKNLSDKLLIRHKINHMSDFAKVDYQQGLMESVSNPDAAKKLFAKSEQTMLSCLELANSLGWQRGIAYLCNKIANINLDIAQITQELNDKRDFLNRVEQYLGIGKPIADRNKCNRRRTGSYLLSSARLESMRGEIELSKVSFVDIPSTFKNPADTLSIPEQKALDAIYMFDGQGNERKAKQVMLCFPDLQKKVPKLELLSV